MVVVNVEALTDGLFVVVSTSGSLATIDEALDEHFIWHIQFEHARHLSAAFSQHFLQGFSLRNGAGEAVEDNAFARTQAIVNTGQDVNHQRVGDELAVVDVPLSGVAEFRTVFDFCTENIAR